MANVAAKKESKNWLNPFDPRYLKAFSKDYIESLYEWPQELNGLIPAVLDVTDEIVVIHERAMTIGYGARYIEEEQGLINAEAHQLMRKYAKWERYRAQCAYDEAHAYVFSWHKPLKRKDPKLIS